MKWTIHTTVWSNEIDFGRSRSMRRPFVNLPERTGLSVASNRSYFEGDTINIPEIQLY